MRLFVVTLAIKFILWLRFPKHIPTSRCYPSLLADFVLTVADKVRASKGSILRVSA